MAIELKNDSKSIVQNPNQFGKRLVDIMGNGEVMPLECRTCGKDILLSDVAILVWVHKQPS